MLHRLLVVTSSIMQELGLVFRTQVSRNCLLLPGSPSILKQTIRISVCSNSGLRLEASSKFLYERLRDTGELLRIILAQNESDENGRFVLNAADQYKVIYLAELCLAPDCDRESLKAMLSTVLSTFDRSFLRRSEEMLQFYYMRTIPRIRIPQRSADPALSTERSFTIDSLVQFLITTATNTGKHAQLIGSFHIEINTRDSNYLIVTVLSDNLVMSFSNSVLLRPQKDVDEQIRLSSILCWKFPLLCYSRKETSLDGVYKVHFGECRLRDETECFILLTMKAAEEEFEAAVWRCRAMEMPVSPMTDVAECLLSIRYEQTGSSFEAMRALFPSLQVHPQSFALILPPAPFGFISVPLSYEPLWAAFRWHPAAVQSAIVRISPLLRDFLFEEVALCSFLSPEREVRIAPIKVSNREVAVQEAQAVNEFLLKLLRGCGKSNWVPRGLQHIPSKMVDSLDLARRRIDPSPRRARLQLTEAFVHPYIAPVLGVEVDGRTLVETRLQSFDEFLNCRPKMELVLEVLLQVAEALDFIHAKGGLHLNVCPSTVSVSGGMAQLSPPLLFRSCLVPETFSTFTAPELVAQPFSARLSPAMDSYSFASLLQHAGVQQGDSPCIQRLMMAVRQSTSTEQRATIFQFRELLHAAATE